MIKISRLTKEERKEYGWLKLDLSINIFGNKLRFNTKKKNKL